MFLLRARASVASCVSSFAFRVGRLVVCDCMCVALSEVPGCDISVKASTAPFPEPMPLHYWHLISEPSNSPLSRNTFQG